MQFFCCYFRWIADFFCRVNQYQREFSKYFSLFVSQSVMLQKTNLFIFYKVFMILYCLIITNSLTFPCYMITKHPHYNLLCPLVPQWFLCSSTYECFLLVFIWLFYLEYSGVGETVEAPMYYSFPSRHQDGYKR